MHIVIDLPNDFDQLLSNTASLRGFSTPEDFVLSLIKRELSGDASQEKMQKLAKAIAQELKGLKFTQSGIKCTWSQVVPYGGNCSNTGDHQVKFAFLGDGMVTDADWKTAWLCDQHLQLLKENNSYEMEES